MPRKTKNDTPVISRRKKDKKKGKGSKISKKEKKLKGNKGNIDSDSSSEDDFYNTARSSGKNELKLEVELKKNQNGPKKTGKGSNKKGIKTNKGAVGTTTTGGGGGAGEPGGGLKSPLSSNSKKKNKNVKGTTKYSKNTKKQVYALTESETSSTNYDSSDSSEDDDVGIAASPWETAADTRKKRLVNARQLLEKKAKEEAENKGKNEESEESEESEDLELSKSENNIEGDDDDDDEFKDELFGVTSWATKPNKTPDIISKILEDISEEDEEEEEEEEGEGSDSSEISSSSGSDRSAIIDAPPLPPRTEEEGYISISKEDILIAKHAAVKGSRGRGRSSTGGRGVGRGGGRGGGGNKKSVIASQWESKLKEENSDHAGHKPLQAVPWVVSGAPFNSVTKLKQNWGIKEDSDEERIRPKTLSRSTSNLVKERASAFLEREKEGGSPLGRGGGGGGTVGPRGRLMQRGRGRGGRGGRGGGGGGVVAAAALFEKKKTGSAPIVASEGVSPSRKTVSVPKQLVLDTARVADLEGVLGGKGAHPQGTARARLGGKKKSIDDKGDKPKRSDSWKKTAPSGGGGSPIPERRSATPQPIPKKLHPQKISSGGEGRISLPSAPTDASKLDYSLEYSVDEESNQLIVVGGHPEGLLQRCFDEPKQNFDQDLYIQCFLITHPLFYESKTLLNDLMKIWVEEEAAYQELKKGEHKLTTVQIRVLGLLHKWVYEFNSPFIMSPELRSTFSALARVIRDRRETAAGKSKKRAKKYLKQIELLLDMAAKMEELGETQKRITQLVVQATRDDKAIDKDALTNEDFSSKDYLSPIPREFSPKDMAQQLTLSQNIVFKRIFPREMYKCAWMKKKGTAPNAVRIIHTFNNVSYWIQTQIVCTTDLKQRIKLVSKFINMGKELLALNNFNGVMLVLSALNNSSIQRLRDTWDGLSSKNLRIYNALQEIFNPEGNFALYRDALNNATPPCIPFMGIFLKNITYIDENDNRRNGRLNFNKMMIMGRALLELRRFQTATWQIKPIPTLLTFFLGRARRDKKGYERMKWVTEKPIHAQSLRIRPRPGSKPTSSTTTTDTPESDTKTTVSFSKKKALKSNKDKNARENKKNISNLSFSPSSSSSSSSVRRKRSSFMQRSNSSRDMKSNPKSPPLKSRNIKDLGKKASLEEHFVSPRESRKNPSINNAKKPVLLNNEKKRKSNNGKKKEQPTPSSTTESIKEKVTIKVDVPISKSLVATSTPEKGEKKTSKGKKQKSKSSFQQHTGSARVRRKKKEEHCTTQEDK